MTFSLTLSRYGYTFADYLTVERDSEVKHELDAGDILTRPGGTARHNALAAKVASALDSTGPQGCLVFESSLRVRIAATGRATYPDASMVCGALEYDSEDAAHTTITNPVLLVEVLSVTTEKGDRRNWEYFEVHEGSVTLTSGPALDLATL